MANKTTNQVTVIPGMSICDAALASAGSLEDLFALALLNGKSITEDLQSGVSLQSTTKKYLQSSAVTLPLREANKAEVMAGQTMLDLAIQEAGGLQAVFELSLLNQKSLTSMLEQGQSVQYPARPENTSILNAYKTNKWKPASAAAIPGVKEPEILGGVGYWTIGQNFTVS